VKSDEVLRSGVAERKRLEAETLGLHKNSEIFAH